MNIRDLYSEHLFKWFVLAFLGVLIFGALAVLSVISSTEQNLIKESLSETRLAASGIDIKELGLLNGSPSDLSTREYKHLHSYLDDIISNQPIIEAVYILGVRENNTVLYYLSSHREEIKSIPPGSRYIGPLAEFHAVSSARSGFGPVRDPKNGIITTGLALRNIRTGGIIGVVGVDISEHYWLNQVLSALAFPIAGLVFIITLLLTFFFVHRVTTRQNQILRASEQALRESEELFRSPIEHSLAGVFVQQEGILQYINPKGAEIFGYSPDEILKTPVMAHVFPDDANRVLALLNQNDKSTLSADNFEFRGVKKDGQIIELVILFSYMAYQGKPAMFGTFLDISARKKVEGALRESESRFRSLFEQASEGILVASEEGAFIDANQAICKMLGYSREELLHLSVNDIIAPDSSPRQPIQLPEIMVGKEFRSNLVLKKKDNSVVFVDMSLKKLDDGRVIAFYRDITQQKQSEEALQEAKNFLDKILNVLKDPIFVKDSNYRWILINDAFCDLIGENKNYLLGKTDYDIFPKDQADVFRKYDELVISSGDDNEHEEEILDVSGTLHTISTKKSSYTSISGERILVGIIRDITDRKRMENNIRRSLEEKEILLHEVHHRVNNNLQIISSLISMQIRNISDETVIRLLRENQSRIFSISLVYEMLSHSENMEQIDLQVFLQKLTKSVFALYHGDSSRISVKISGSDLIIPIIQAVPLGLIIRELLSNSLLYAFPSGSTGNILISVMGDDETQMYTCIYTDDGIGIGDEVDIESGKTMGLSLIRGLTKQLSGDIAFRRTAGVQVTILFPGFTPAHENLLIRESNPVVS